MKTLYMDCYSGISGDMTLGALLDLGADQTEFLKRLSQLGLEDEYRITIRKDVKMGITGTKVRVDLLDGQANGGVDVDPAKITEEHHHGHAHIREHEHEHEHKDHHHHQHRGLSDILKILEDSGLPGPVKVHASAIFLRLAHAEAHVHGTTPEEVHFHEVGAVDALVDIVGSAILMDMLGIERVISGPVNVGSGTVKCAHGIMPVPAPATAELLIGVPTYAGGRGERTTPTGAAILTHYCGKFEPMPVMQVKAVGYGIGHKDFEVANCLRIALAEETEEVPSRTVAVLEANLDDMTGEMFGFLMDQLMEEGALDVTFQQVMMKKNRPGVLVSVVCEPEQRIHLTKILMRESTTLGVRSSLWEREVAPRSFKELDTPWGMIRAKLAKDGFTLEYEDLKRIAQEKNLPLPEVYRKLYAYGEKCLDKDEHSL